jgi:hypothetical protein
MDTAPIVGLFNQLMTVGLALGAVVCAFFLILAGCWRRPRSANRGAAGRDRPARAAFPVLSVKLPAQNLRRASAGVGRTPTLTKS